MSNESTTVKSKRKLPAPLTNEQIYNLKVGDQVAARESGKLYQIVEVTPEGLKGRALAGLTVTGPTRPLVGKNLTTVQAQTAANEVKAFDAVTRTDVQTATADAVANIPDPATVAPNGPAAKLAAQKDTTVIQTIKPGDLKRLGAEQQAQQGKPEQPKTPAVAPATKKPQPEVKKPVVKQVYKLEVNGRTTRYERVTADLIRVRNRERERGNNQGRWVEIAEADVPRGFTISEPLQYTPAERAALAAEGHRKDDEFMTKREAQKSKKTEKTETEDTEKTEKKSSKPKGEKKAKTERPEYHGLGMCEFLRYMGSKNYDKKVIKIVAEKCGFSPSPTTVHIQTKKGEDGENVSTPSKDARNELKTFIEEAKAQVAEEKAEKAAKKDDKKSSKKSGKGKKKAAKKDESDDDDSEDEEADEAPEEAADEEADEEADDSDDEADDDVE